MQQINWSTGRHFCCPEAVHGCKESPRLDSGFLRLAFGIGFVQQGSLCAKGQLLLPDMSGANGDGSIDFAVEQQSVNAPSRAIGRF